LRHVVCLITDRGRLGSNAEAALIRRVSAAARAGVHLVQIRERNLPDRALLALVTQAVEAARPTRTRVLVNDRVDVAITSGAHGVHLRSDSVAASRVRAVAPPGFLVGRSVHSSAEAARLAEEGGLDYLMFGSVFETSSKPGRAAAGVAGLAAAVAAARTLPVLAVGGITAQTLGAVWGSGCAGFAAIGMFADGPEDALAETVAAALAPCENPG
jgi:thiamine-phosphate pyrophosphorylase